MSLKSSSQRCQYSGTKLLNRMSHPFSVAWVERGPAVHAPCRSRTLPLSQAQTLTSHPSQDLEVDFEPLPRKQATAISCIVASRTGMTAALFKKARKSTTGAITLKAFVEGPYGGLENMRSYGTVVLFAGGVGITHQISILHGLVCAFADGTCATRKAVLVWSVREVEQLEWVGRWMDELVNMPRRGNELKVLLYVTRTSVVESGNGVVFKETGGREEVTFGRMNVRDLVRREFENRVGAMCVGVCGPGGLADDVRMATREVMGLGKVDFWEESFTW
jgi:hypothetical protein